MKKLIFLLLMFGSVMSVRAQGGGNLYGLYTRNAPLFIENEIRDASLVSGVVYPILRVHKLEFSHSTLFCPSTACWWTLPNP